MANWIPNFRRDRLIEVFQNNILHLKEIAIACGVRQLPKVQFTSIGGLAVKLTNKSGASSTKGRLVDPATGSNNAVTLTGVDDTECIGVFLNDGVPDGQEAWIVIAGIAEVALDDNTAATRGNWVGASEAGYADATGGSPPAQPAHFREIGHCTETVSATGAGTHVTAKCVLHFN